MLRVRHYRIDEQSDSLTEKYIVYNVENKVAYTIGYDTSDLSGNLTLSDADGEKVFHIYQKQGHGHLTYCIYATRDLDNTVAVVERIGIPLHHKFKIESPYGKYQMERIHKGFSHDYNIKKDDEKVAMIYRKPPEGKESYAIDINLNVNENEDLFIIAFAFILRCAHG